MEIVLRSAVCATSIFALTFVAFGQTATLRLSSGSGLKGTTVSLPLAYVSNGAQAAGVQWSFLFSPADFSNVSVISGPSASNAGKTISCNSPASGQYVCLITGMNSNVIADGTIATANLTLSSSTAANSSAVQVASASASSASGDAVAAAGSTATVTINSPPVALNSLACSPTSVTAPASSQCTVSLSGPAPSGGVAVSVGWSSSAATVSAPTSVTVASGASTAQFAVQISAATASTSVQVSASLNSTTKVATINVSPGASISVSVSPSSVTLGPGGSQQFTASVSGTSNTAVTWSLSSSTGKISSTGLYTAPSSISQQQTVTVRATSVADTTKFATAVVTLNPPGSSSSPVSFWPATATPGTITDPDANSVELGLKFSSTVAGSVTGVRFYKGSSNTGTHVGHLWTSSGTLLATVTFTNETATGWQQANFSKPVKIAANTVYVISYTAPKGHYSDDQNYAWSSLNAAPLSVSGSSPGVYAYGSSVFPGNTWNNSNYWVDVVFAPGP